MPTPKPQGRKKTNPIARTVDHRTTPSIMSIKRSRALVNLKASTFTRLPQASLRAVPVAPSSVETTAPDETIYILAFICKPLPKCPNPDPTLQWEV